MMRTAVNPKHFLRSGCIKWGNYYFKDSVRMTALNYSKNLKYQNFIHFYLSFAAKKSFFSRNIALAQL